MELIDHLEQEREKGAIPNKIAAILIHFIKNYLEEAKGSLEDEVVLQQRLSQFITFGKEQLSHPYSFSLFHKAIRKPFDYLAFGKKLIEPLIVLPESSVKGLNHVDAMVRMLSQGENVILFGNHQTEPDPQIISLLLEKTHQDFAEEIIFVAGNRVTTDPLAIPFSLGVNLLCIYSKRYLENPPENKKEKLAHNHAVMRVMKSLLSEGGKCIYVAPSGGRDRPGLDGKATAAPFEPASIEMFRIVANASGKKTHFFPLALSTYQLMPPPKTIEPDLMENRTVNRTPVKLSFGKEIDLNALSAMHDQLDKECRREALAKAVWENVNQLYLQL